MSTTDEIYLIIVTEQERAVLESQIAMLHMLLLALRKVTMAFERVKGHTGTRQWHVSRMQTDLSIPEHLQLLCNDLHTIWGCQHGLVELLVAGNMSQDGISMSQGVHVRLAAVATSHETNDVFNASCFCISSKCPACHHAH